MRVGPSDPNRAVRLRQGTQVEIDDKVQQRMQAKIDEYQKKQEMKNNKYFDEAKAQSIANKKQKVVMGMQTPHISRENSLQNIKSIESNKSNEHKRTITFGLYIIMYMFNILIN